MSDEKKTRAPKKNLAERFEEQIQEEVDKHERLKEKVAAQEKNISRMREALGILKATTPAKTGAAAGAKK